MGDERKKRVWPWIVAVLIGLPVLYVASFGPACWISSHMNSGARVVSLLYQPLMRAWWHGRQTESDVLQRYVRLNAKKTWVMTLRDNGLYSWDDWGDFFRGGTVPP